MSFYQESRCCSADYMRGLSGHYIDLDLQKMTYDFANEFKISDRNIIRKLSKQYRIIAIHQEEDNYFENSHRRYIIQAKPYIIKYQNWETNDPFFKPFEWGFNLNQ